MYGTYLLRPLRAYAQSGAGVGSPRRSPTFIFTWWCVVLLKIAIRRTAALKNTVGEKRPTGSDTWYVLMSPRLRRPTTNVAEHIAGRFYASAYVSIGQKPDAVVVVNVELVAQPPGSSTKTLS